MTVKQSIYDCGQWPHGFDRVSGITRNISHAQIS